MKSITIDTKDFDQFPLALAAGLRTDRLVLTDSERFNMPALHHVPLEQLPAHICFSMTHSVRLPQPPPIWHRCVQLTILQSSTPLTIDLGELGQLCELTIDAAPSCTFQGDRALDSVTLKQCQPTNLPSTRSLTIPCDALHLVDPETRHVHLNGYSIVVDLDRLPSLQSLTVDDAKPKIRVRTTRLRRLLLDVHLPSGVRLIGPCAVAPGCNDAAMLKNCAAVDLTRCRWRGSPQLDLVHVRMARIGYSDMFNDMSEKRLQKLIVTLQQMPNLRSLHLRLKQSHGEIRSESRSNQRPLAQLVASLPQADAQLQLSVRMSICFDSWQTSSYSTMVSNCSNTPLRIRCKGCSINLRQSWTIRPSPRCPPGPM